MEQCWEICTTLVATTFLWSAFQPECVCLHPFVPFGDCILLSRAIMLGMALLLIVFILSFGIGQQECFADPLVAQRSGLTQRGHEVSLLCVMTHHEKTAQ